MKFKASSLIVLIILRIASLKDSPLVRSEKLKLFIFPYPVPSSLNSSTSRLLSCFPSLGSSRHLCWNMRK